MLLNYDKNDVIINFNSVNRSENMKVFIVGGTGLLGAAGAKELISRGQRKERCASAAAEGRRYSPGDGADV